MFESDARYFLSLVLRVFILLMCVDLLILLECYASREKKKLEKWRQKEDPPPVHVAAVEVSSGEQEDPTFCAFS